MAPIICRDYCTRYLTNSTVFRLDFWISEEFRETKEDILYLFDKFSVLELFLVDFTVSRRTRITGLLQHYTNFVW